MMKPNHEDKENMLIKKEIISSKKMHAENRHRKQLKQLINESIMSQSISNASFVSQEDVQKEGKQKLIELTRQCSHYFQKFTAENDQHIKVISNIFGEYSLKIQVIFERIAKEVFDQLEEIKIYLKKQQNRLIEQRKKQEESLNYLLMKIHTVHLTKIQQNSKASNQTLTEYAFTLNQFFNKMEYIQGKISQDNLQQCFHYINNLAKEELKNIISNNFPTKVHSNPHISLSHENCFTFQDCSNKPLQESQSSLFNPSFKQTYNKSHDLQDEFQQIKLNHALRQKRLKEYNLYLRGHVNPFAGIKLS